MKIYFLNLNAGINDANASDYQLDCLFHGLNKLGTVELHTNLNWWWMLKGNEHRRDRLWGKLFNLGFTLDEHPTIPNIGDYHDSYDLVILGIHHTLNNCSNEEKSYIIQRAKSSVIGKKYAVIDGWDRPDMPTKMWGDDTTYFKRELYTNYEEWAKPISFAIPDEKICSINELALREVKYEIAPLIPVNQSIDPSYMSTYVYNTEEEYNKMYQQSICALTSKKGGWDTMRHLEIMANGCIPIFVDIENCPPKTLWNFPKTLALYARKFAKLNLINGETYDPLEPLPHCGVINKDNPGTVNELGFPDWRIFRANFWEYTKENLTTKHLAKYVVESCKI